MAHKPVMYDECLELLDIKQNGTYLDLTVGGFGHGSGICERLSEEGTYIGIDMDAEAIERATNLTQKSHLSPTLIFSHTHFKRFAETLAWNGIDKIDGCLIDLGVSSFQLDESRRGFSFKNEAMLDMRMDQDASFNAMELVNTYSKSELLHILTDYADERFAYRIAQRICEERLRQPITTTTQLADLVSSAIPKKFHVKGKHPATKTFLAIRIAVNDEISHLRESILSLIEYLKPQGRLVVLSFHSAEDRFIKHAFLESAKGCTCPKDFPICVCGKTPQVTVLTKSPRRPTVEETNANPRARSALLRACEKI
jgi:16S rRNA (cytosine1402-N4)-methyltransferase